MKKTRFIVFALTVSILLMGAGYAAWNEVIELDATVNSTYLNIGLQGEWTQTYSQGTFDPATYGTECAITFANNARGAATNSSKATVNFINLFPGVKQTATILFINDSLIPVKLDKVVYSPVTGNQTLIDATNVKLSSVEYNPGDPTNLSALAGNTYEGSSLWDFYLEPGQQLTYVIEVDLPYSTDNAAQLKNFSFDVETTFIQK